MCEPSTFQGHQQDDQVCPTHGRTRGWTSRKRVLIGLLGRAARPPDPRWAPKRSGTHRAEAGRGRATRSAGAPVRPQAPRRLQGAFARVRERRPATSAPPRPPSAHLLAPRARGPGRSLRAACPALPPRPGAPQVCGRGAEARRAAIFGEVGPRPSRRREARGHPESPGGRSGRGTRPRSSPYLVKQAAHWPAGQRAAAGKPGLGGRPPAHPAPRVPETLSCAPREGLQAECPRAGRLRLGSPAGVREGGTCTDFSVLQLGRGRPRPRSHRGVLDCSLEGGGTRTSPGRGPCSCGSPWVPRARRPRAAAALCQKWVCLPIVRIKMRLREGL